MLGWGQELWMEAVETEVIMEWIEIGVGIGKPAMWKIIRRFFFYQLKREKTIS